MKVISLLQPWASLVVIGAKKIETRSWQTKHTGELLIHASGTLTDQQIDTGQFFKIKHDVPLGVIKDLPRSAIIGKVNLDGVVRFAADDIAYEFTNGKMWTIDERQKAFGDFSAGRYGWLLSDPMQFNKPIPAKGSLSVWNFPMCRVCGCWEDDACFHPSKGNCAWAEEDLCSHCKNHPGESKRHSSIMGAVKHEMATS